MDTLGYLFVNVSEKTLSSVYHPVGPSPVTGYYIADERGVVISSSDEGRILQPLEPERKAEIYAENAVLKETEDTNGSKVLLMAMPSGRRAGSWSTRSRCTT